MFALCPAGAGPNTLRPCEAMAVGSIPVLIGFELASQPRGGAQPVDWDPVS